MGGAPSTALDARVEIITADVNQSGDLDCSRTTIAVASRSKVENLSGE